MKPPSKDGAHYMITPYSFIPKTGNKLVSNYYVDLGQGIFECMNEIKGELDSEKKG
jgi:UDP-glucose 4-epimerase